MHLQCGRPGSISGLGRSLGKGKGYPLQYSVLENSMDCIAHGVTKSRTHLSDFHSSLISHQDNEQIRAPKVSSCSFIIHAAKSLQSCPTPSDAMDCSLPGSSVRGIFQARVLEWGAIAFSLVHTRRMEKQVRLWMG